MRRAHRDYLAEVEAWRAARLARLVGPDGWLAVVGIAWLNEGGNSVGSDPASAVVLPSAKAPRSAGSIEVTDGRATFHPTPGVPLTHEDAPIAGPLELHDDGVGDPTTVRIGPISFYVIRRVKRLAVRIKDSEAPAIARFRAIERYRVDERWRVECRFEPYEPPREAQVPTVLGTPEAYQVPGAVAFQIGEGSYRLDVFLEEGSTDLFVVFGDKTNGTETFGGGRYIYTPQADADSVVILDFNRAYNPPCVFTAHATCPLPLPQNRLPIRLKAGEKRYKGPTQ